MVELGDTVASIAMKQKVTLGDIYALNPNLNSRTMAAGDVLRLPVGSAAAKSPPPAPQPTVQAATPQPPPVVPSSPPAVPQSPPAAAEPPQGAPRSAVQAVPLPPPDVQTAAPEPPPLPTARPAPPVAQKAPPAPVHRQAAKPPAKPAPLVVHVRPPARVAPAPAPAPVLATPVPPTGNPAISVSPAAGPSGTVIATAAGFPKFQRLKLFVGPSPADLHVAEWLYTDGNGWASTQTRVPTRLQNDGVAYFQFRTLLGRVSSPVQPQQVAQAQRPRPPAQAPVAVSVVGTISREGTQCRAMRGDDGRLYSLTGNVLLVMLPGLRVAVEGQVASGLGLQAGNDDRRQHDAARAVNAKASRTRVAPAPSSG